MSESSLASTFVSGTFLFLVVKNQLKESRSDQYWSRPVYPGRPAVRTTQIVRRTMADLRGEFLQILEGVSAITLIFDERLFDSVCSMFRRSDILDQKNGLAAIMVHSPKAIIGVPGSAVAFYNPVSRRHINIEETMSCFTDTILVVRTEDVGKAFSSITEMISQARQAMRARPGRVPHHPKRRRR